MDQRREASSPQISVTNISRHRRVAYVPFGLPHLRHPESIFRFVRISGQPERPTKGRCMHRRIVECIINVKHARLSRYERLSFASEASTLDDIASNIRTRIPADGAVNILAHALCKIRGASRFPRYRAPKRPLDSS